MVIGEWGNGEGEKRGNGEWKIANTSNHGTLYGRSHVVALLTNGTGDWGTEKWELENGE